ncbi:MAG: helix-turn-helix transcriptional regulator [Treponema sp.]|nr:helix-turn-helix transcriptional regulator [Treponema sp.]
MMEEKSRIRNVVAQNVRKYRKLEGLTQEQLAEAADVSNTYIANIECGQTWVSDKTLEKVAAALHVEIYLLFISEKLDQTAKDALAKSHENISYLKKRQNDLSNYVKAFFSETFEHIVKD